MTRLTFLLMVIFAAPTSVAAQSTTEADWPKRVIRLIVSAAPGALATQYAVSLRKSSANVLDSSLSSITVLPPPGTIAAEGLARSSPDGYTIGMVTTSTHVIAAISIETYLRSDKGFCADINDRQFSYVLAIYPGLPVKMSLTSWPWQKQNRAN
jgi:tripartite-type tricarboxylate transporter receptor subunit TctC